MIEQAPRAPFRVRFSTVGLVPEETYVAYARENHAAGYPEVGFAEPHDRPLAVVGGGPSAARALEELKSWPGDIWGINQSASWLIEHGVTAPVWMFTVDPGVELAEWTENVPRAILGASCHPKLFQAFKDKDVKLFHTREIPGVTTTMASVVDASETEVRGVDDGSGEEPIKCNLMGPSSVCRVFLPAAMLGYKKVVFFGCEGSIEEKTHAYRDESESRKRQMVIRAGGLDYITTPDFYLTTVFLVDVMRVFGKGLSEKSGGLLRAMLEHPDTWEVVAFSDELRKVCDPTATEPYHPRATHLGAAA